MRAWCDIAQIINTKHLNGGLVVRFTTCSPFVFGAGNAVHIVPPPLEFPRKLTVERVEDVRTSHSDDTAVIYFHEITSADIAQEYVGCHCLMQQKDVEDVVMRLARNNKQHTPIDNEIVGWQVRDRNAGHVGTVHEIRQMPGQLMLVVEGAKCSNDALASNVYIVGGDASELTDCSERDVFTNNVDGVHDAREAKISNARIASNQQREILIPFVEEFIESADEDEQILNLNLPQGLLDL